MGADIFSYAGSRRQILNNGKNHDPRKSLSPSVEKEYVLINDNMHQLSLFEVAVNLP